MTEAITKRTCGGCTACCKTHAVDEVETISGEWCQHCVIGQGCSIYEQRPNGCRLYECLWLKGKGEDSDRPDRLKIVMDGTVVDLPDRQIPTINMWEVEPGAADQQRVQQLTSAFLEQDFVVRHRLSVPPSVSPFRIMDKTFRPETLLTKAEFAVVCKKLHRH